MLPSSLPTVYLTERVPHCCRLRGSDVAFLLEHHSGHIEVAPAGPRQRYRLTARGHVGILLAPTCRFVIRPKIPLVNLLALIDPALAVSLQGDEQAGQSEAELLSFLARQLAVRMQERSAAGLHRDYREEHDQGPFLHGRLDVPAQLRQGPARRDQLHCRFDDFTHDVPCNRLPYWTAERLLALPFLDEHARCALQQAVAGFAASFVPVPMEHPPQVRTAPAEYGPLLELCRLLAEAVAPGNAVVPGKAPAFLLDLDRLFETYLTHQVTAAFANGEPSVAVQPAHVIRSESPEQPDLVLRPDLVLTRRGRPCCVIDAKWKRLPAQAVLTDDLYQVVAYGTALAAPWAILVYPGVRDRFWDYTLGGASLRIGIATLRVVGDLGRCQRSCRRLMRRLAELAVPPA